MVKHISLQASVGFRKPTPEMITPLNKTPEPRNETPSKLFDALLNSDAFTFENASSTNTSGHNVEAAPADRQSTEGSCDLFSELVKSDQLAEEIFSASPSAAGSDKSTIIGTSSFASPISVSVSPPGINQPDAALSPNSLTALLAKTTSSKSPLGANKLKEQPASPISVAIQPTSAAVGFSIGSPFRPFSRDVARLMGSVKSSSLGEIDVEMNKHSGYEGVDSTNEDLTFPALEPRRKRSQTVGACAIDAMGSVKSLSDSLKLKLNHLSRSFGGTSVDTIAGSDPLLTSGSGTRLSRRTSRSVTKLLEEGESTPKASAMRIKMKENRSSSCGTELEEGVGFSSRITLQQKQKQVASSTNVFLSSNGITKPGSSRISLDSQLTDSQYQTAAESRCSDISNCSRESVESKLYTTRRNTEPIIRRRFKPVEDRHSVSSTSSELNQKEQLMSLSVKELRQYRRNLSSASSASKPSMESFQQGDSKQDAPQQKFTQQNTEESYDSFYSLYNNDNYEADIDLCRDDSCCSDIFRQSLECPDCDGSTTTHMSYGDETDKTTDLDISRRKMKRFRRSRKDLDKIGMGDNFSSDESDFGEVVVMDGPLPSMRSLNHRSDLSVDQLVWTEQGIEKKERQAKSREGKVVHSKSSEAQSDGQLLEGVTATTTKAQGPERTQLSH